MIDPAKPGQGNQGDDATGLNGELTLYWGPGTCAIGIHVLLEELGGPYRTVEIDVHGGGTHTPEFLAINPKGKVPTLVRQDGSALTEFSAIATFLALGEGDGALLPRDPETSGRIAEVLAFVEGTIHGQGYGRVMKPEAFEPQDTLHKRFSLGRASVEHQGREIVENGFKLLDTQLERHPYAVGKSFTIADVALYYTERWAPRYDIELPLSLQNHLSLMRSRPSVRLVEQSWGEG